MIEDLLWQQVKDKLYITEEEYKAGLAGWTITPHEADGETVGCVMTKGPELHFATFGQRWRMTKADIRHYLTPLLNAHGFVQTCTPLDDERQQRFNRLLGFKESGRDDCNVHFTITKSDFDRRFLCRR